MIGESFARIVLGHIRRFSISKHGVHHMMLILGINFCPCKKSFIETFFCTYYRYVRYKSSKLNMKQISSGLLFGVKCKYVEC